MLEFIWHARGGRGAFTAARCLGAAAALSGGYEALAFPTFGPERRGAPMRAFTKLAHEPIGDRSACPQGDFVLYLDETLWDDTWEQQVKPGGLVLVNTPKLFGDERVICFDADGISAEILGRPIPNTAFLGALCAVSDVLTLSDVEAGIQATMPAKLHAKNVAVAEAAYESVRDAYAYAAALVESLESEVTDGVL